MTRQEISRVVAALNGRTQTEAFEAAKCIWEDADPRLERPLLATLKHGKKAFHRAAAAFAMQMMTTPRVIAALEQTVKNQSEVPRVRGEAAEALAHAHRKRTHDVLLRSLNDRSKDVRFWCAYALAEMGELRAIPLLKELAATDKRAVRGFHSVAKEAADALRTIAGNKAHRRTWGCIFCRRSS